MIVLGPFPNALGDCGAMLGANSEVQYDSTERLVHLRSKTVSNGNELKSLVKCAQGDVG